MGAEKIICDSDIIIDYLDSNNKRYQATVDTLLHKIRLSNVLVSAITKIELIVGVRDKKELQRLDRNIGIFTLLKIDTSITETAIDLVYKYNLSHGLALPDAFIAATAIELQIPLFTYNVKDYKFIDGLMLYTP